MPNQVTYVNTQKQSTNVPSGAFGDYSGLQSLARAADDVIQVTQYLKQKEDRRSLAEFELKNTQFVDELKTQDLKPSEFIQQYESFFNKEVEAFPTMKTELTNQIFHGTIKGAEFRRHVAELEEKETNRFFEAANNQVMDWITSNISVNTENMESLHRLFVGVDPEDALQKEKASALEEVMLRNADSLEQFDKMAKMSRFIRQDHARIDTIRKGLERDLEVETNRMKAQLDADVKEQYNMVGQWAVGQKPIDTEALIQAGAEGETVRKAYVTNFFLESLKNQIHRNDDFFARGMNKDTVLDIIGDMSKIMNASEITRFQQLAKELHDMEPSQRLQYNPDVQAALAKEDYETAIDTMVKYLGQPQEGEEPSLFFGHDNTQIGLHLVTDEFVKEEIDLRNPVMNDRDAILARKAEVKAKYGAHADLVEMAIMHAIMNGRKGVSADPGMGAYLGITQFGGDWALDAFYDGYSSRVSLRDFAEKLGFDNSKEMELTILQKVSESAPLQVFYDAIEGPASMVDPGAMDDLVIKTVAHMATERNGNLGLAVEDFVNNMTEDYMVLDTPNGQKVLFSADQEITSHDWTINDLINQYLPSGEKLAQEEMVGGLFDPFGVAPNPLKMGKAIWKTVAEKYGPRGKRQFEQHVMNRNLKAMLREPETNIGEEPRKWYDEPLRRLSPLYWQARASESMYEETDDRMEVLNRIFHISAPKLNHIWNPGRYQWGDTPSSTAMDLYNRTLVESGPGGLLRTGPNIEIVRATKDGVEGFNIYTSGKDVLGENPELDSPKRIPYMDKELGAPAFFPRELLNFIPMR